MTYRKRTAQQLEQICEQWNKLHPISTEVEYHPVIGEPAHRLRRTRSGASVLSDHTAVVFLEDESGCVAIEACVPVRGKSEQNGGRFMTKTMELERGDAYCAVKYVYDKSPGKSWRRLNSALSSALESAIIAHLSFCPDDFAAIARDMNGGYWMGNSVGSVTGERYYGLAVQVSHTPACISFERYARRPAALWCEKVKTPERLHVGSDFTWKGLLLTVTNMRPDHLIACCYGERAHEPHVYLDDYRRIEHQAALSDGCLAVRLSPPMRAPERKPEKVVTIPYAELAIVRKKADLHRKEALAAISAVDNATGLAELTQKLLDAPRGTFRHFDIEDIRKALQAKETDIGRAESEAEQLSRWLSAGRLTRAFSQVKLRIVGEYVETSTGQSVSLSAVRRVLPFVLHHRDKTVYPENLIVDIHPVNRISAEGVTVGCTLIPWLEVERLAVQINGTGGAA